MFTRSDIFDGLCTAQQYAKQYPSVVPQLGSVYTQCPNQWDESEYKIIFTDDTIAVGVEVSGLSIKVGGKGSYCLFYSSGLYTGWKYQDTSRPYYRLQEL
jgi:hypothetical protein